MRDKPVQWMTAEELRAERERTRPAWEAAWVDVATFLDTGELPGLTPAARRHQAVTDELTRRATSDGVQQAAADPDAPPTNPGEPTNSA